MVLLQYQAVERTKVKCLLVDDLEDNLVALSAVLRRSGVEIFTARSGAEALELLLKHDMALAILDVQMPEMDGFELAELMRSSQRTQHVPIIFVTAGSRDPLRLFRGYDQGAVDFLYKPIEAPILLSKAEVFFDMYRQRQQLAEELKSRTQALQLNEMCMGVLGHDLRNPLNAILLNAKVLTLGDGSDAHERATSIIESGERMARMIEDLLDVTRARLGGGLNATRVSVDIRPVIEAVVNEHRAAHSANTVTLEVNGDFNGCWDSDRVAQAVSNIIGNAIEHGEAAGNIHVELDGTASDYVLIKVGNRGEISPELLPSIFDPFSFRNMHSRRSGLGLGLFIVQQIVQAHNGNIDVQSKDGFTVIGINLPRLD